MRGMLFLVLVIAASGCLMQPYSGGSNQTNNTNVTAAPTAPAPLPRACLGPVCGADGQTYETDCEAYDARIAVLYTGECHPPEPECNDSDSGLNISVAGAVIKGNETHADYCLDSAQLVEYDCLDNTITMSTVQCGSHSECKDGQCVAKNESVQNQTAELVCTGVSAADVYTRDNVTWNGTTYADLCVDYKSVKDYFCQDQKLVSINHECDPGYGCTNGTCTHLALICIASVAANDTSIRGKTSVSRGMGTMFEDFDTCMDLQILRKYYCLENGSDAYTEASCGSGKKCMDGRCVRSTCTETDAGIDIYHAGTTTVSTRSNEDDCTDTNTIREYYCYGDNVLSEEIECGSGYVCDNGACVRSPIY